MHKFKNGDRVQITNLLSSPFHKCHGTVVGYNDVSLWVQFNTGQTVGFSVEAVKSSPIPKEGDRVRITRPTGQWTAQEGEVLRIVNGMDYLVDLDISTVPFYSHELEVIESFGPHRVEGQEIHFDAVKIGDVVECSSREVEHGVETFTARTGTVGTKHVGGLLRTTGGTVLCVPGSKITLIKDIESDAIMQTLTDMSRESIISFRSGTKNELIVGVKLGDDAWSVMNPGNAKITKTLALRERIRRDAGNKYYLVQAGK